MFLFLIRSFPEHVVVHLFQKGNNVGSGLRVLSPIKSVHSRTWDIFAWTFQKQEKVLSGPMDSALSKRQSGVVFAVITQASFPHITSLSVDYTNQIGIVRIFVTRLALGEENLTAFVRVSRRRQR
jgi:hypothetical protein